MIKTEGKLHAEIVKLLKGRGVEGGGIAVATLSRGVEHLVLRDGETIGEYNHKSKRLLLYKTEK